MQAIFKTLFVGAVLVIGTWKLNLAKSKFSPGPAPKSQTRTYVESAQGITLTVNTTAADGKETTTTLTFKDDGKPYAVIGSPDFDMVSVKRVDANTVHSTQMKAGATGSSCHRPQAQSGSTLLGS